MIILVVYYFLLNKNATLVSDACPFLDANMTSYPLFPDYRNAAEMFGEVHHYLWVWLHMSQKSKWEYPANCNELHEWVQICCGRKLLTCRKQWVSSKFIYLFYRIYITCCFQCILCLHLWLHYAVQNICLGLRHFNYFHLIFLACYWVFTVWIKFNI